MVAIGTGLINIMMEIIETAQINMLIIIIISLSTTLKCGHWYIFFLLPDPGVSGVRSMGPGVCTSPKTFLKLC